MEKRQSKSTALWTAATVLQVASLVALLAAVLAMPAAALGAAPARFEVDAYQDQFGVSKTVAAERLEVQTKGASAHVGERLGERLGDDFGGLWFDNETGEYVIALTSSEAGRRADRNVVADELAAASLDGTNYRTVSVESSWSDLLHAGDQVAERLDGLIEGGKVRVQVDPIANAVIVGIRASEGAPAAPAIVRGLQGVGVEIDIETVEARGFDKKLLTCANNGIWLKSCGLPLRGGTGIREAGLGTYQYGFCSAGFRATGKSDGRRYLLTAGHCVKDLNENENEQWESVVWNWETWDPVTGTGQPIGALTQWNYPHHDWAKIDVTNTWGDSWPWNTVVYWGRGEYGGVVDEEYEINGIAENQVGHQACHSGIATGSSCGTITRLEKAFNPHGGGEGTIVDAWEAENTKTGNDLCLLGGDSGGAVFSNHYALGIVSYGTHFYCHPETAMNYVDIGEAAADLGVTLAPGSNPPPPPPPPAPTVETKPATNVSEFQATLNGAVNPNGLETTYRFDYGTTTSYGESVPVPSVSVGGGTGTVAVSNVADRLEPGTTYHYRLVANSAGGITYGADQAFHTPGSRFMRGLSDGSGVSSWNTTIGMDLPPMAVGDVNGDGKDDVVSVERDNGLYRYKFGYSAGWGGIPSWEQVLSGMGRPIRLAVGDLSGDGKDDVLAVEPQGNGKYRYMLGTGTGAGISDWDQIMGDMSYPHKLALEDLSGDGKADIVSVESQGNGKYRYMLGTSNGTGIGSWSQILSEMSYAEFMDLADFDADGKADVIAVENQGNGKFRYMLGISTGTGISSWSQVMSEMSGPYFLNAGDFNADGKADIVSLESDGAGKYRYMLGAGNGTGIGSWSQVMGGMGLPVRSDLGDLTGDGKVDIVSVETESTGSYNYRLGVSGGSGVSFWLQLVSWMRTPRATGVGDFNADGKADIVSVESEGNGKYRYKLGFSGASSNLTNWRTVLTGMSLPNALGVADFTGDGKADIVAVEPDGSGKYRYMLGKSSGTGISSWGSVLSGMSLPTRMDLADFSGDGKADIIVYEPAGSGQYRIMRGLSSGTGISSWGQVLGGLGYPHKTAVADLTGDGKADIVSVESQGGGQYRYMLGKSSGTGISSWSQILANMAYAEFLDLGDFTGDGKADVLSVENQGGGQFRFMLGTSNGAGIGSWSQVMGNMAGPYFFHAGDLNADGKDDIVSAETM